MEVNISGGTRVLLCQPWDHYDENKPFAKKKLAYRYPFPHYGIVLLATLAQKAGYTVKVFDAEAELVMQGKGDNRYILAYRIPRLIEEFHPDIVGISCSASYRWPEAYQMAKIFDTLRKNGSSFKIILGGHHVTSQFEDVFRQAPFIDWVHIGESEQSFLEVLSGADPKQVKGTAWLEDGKIYQNPPSILGNIDKLPYPDWSLLDLSYYASPNKVILKSSPPKIFKWLPVMTSRGCPYCCSFCTYKHQRLRKHSAEYIGGYIDYILEAYADYEIDALYCGYDALITKELLHQLCQQIVDRGIHKKVIWVRTLRTSNTAREDLVALQKAGCVRVLYGYESGSNRILKAMNKQATAEDGIRVAQYHHELGFEFQAVFMVGYPGERWEDVKLTQKLLQTIKPTDYSVGKFVPMPGSPIFNTLRAEGKIHITTPDDYRRYSEISSPEAVNFSGMDDETLKAAWKMLLCTADEVSETGQAFGRIHGNKGNRLKRFVRSWFE